ncbi:MAG: hypothetical protein H7Y38_11535 [Armatimonadetes bacterium]|nr:hypothetical protein [Armatimonadota bacterium]
MDRTDAYSFFLHETGHALSFNGFRDFGTGQLTGNFQSIFDQFVELVDIDGDDVPFFNGDAAVAEYGGLVPLTFGNLYHVGNGSPLPGDDLIPDMMNGVVYFRGTRYDISALDLAIASDAGLPLAPVVVPESGSFALLLPALALIVRWRKSPVK